MSAYPYAKRRQPTFHVLEDGSQIVRVPLQRPGLFATVDRKDFDHLMSIGITNQWSLISDGKGRDYVACCLSIPEEPGKYTLTTIGRLIMAGGTRKRVQYADGDRLNLRRANLIETRGSGKARLGRLLHDRAILASDREEPAITPPPLETPPSWLAGSWRQELSRAVQSWLRRSRVQALEPTSGDQDRPMGRREVAWARFVARQPDGATAHA